MRQSKLHPAVPVGHCQTPALSNDLGADLLHRDEKEVLGQYIPLLYHYNMLQDADRVGAFSDAIKLLIKPGMNVLELGGGTGILSSLAARQGARVYCVERNGELADLASTFIRHNDLAERIEVIHADALHYVPPVPIDVVICEMLHVGLLREKQAQVIDAFKRNYQCHFDHTLPIFIPELSMLMLQPIQQDFEFAGYRAPVPMFQAPIMGQPRTIELASFIPYANVGYADTIPMRYETSLQFKIQCNGELNAIRFATQNVLGIDMTAQRAIAWANQCLVLPIHHPITCQKGDLIDIGFCYSAGEAVERLWESIEVRHITSDVAA